MKLLICSVCGKPIPDPCQAHYLDGPVCTPCLAEDFPIKDHKHRTEKDCYCGGHNASNTKSNKHHNSTAKRIQYREGRQLKPLDAYGPEGGKGKIDWNESVWENARRRTREDMKHWSDTIYRHYKLKAVRDAIDDTERLYRSLDKQDEERLYPLWESDDVVEKRNNGRLWDRVMGLE